MGLRCFFLDHEYHERDWSSCVHCHEKLPSIENEPLTFEEGVEYGLKIASDRLYSFATKIESKDSNQATILRKAASKLIYSEDQDWYKP